MRAAKHIHGPPRERLSKQTMDVKIRQETDPEKNPELKPAV
jgi:hypothetical protein